MQTFQTLLKREWMQHRLGWLLLGGVPFAIMVPLMSFGSIQFGDTAPPPGMAALIIAMGYIFFLLVLAGGAVAIQTPGLARRDRQDRSIEFWLSLPVGHTQAVGATVLMHLLAMPLLMLGLAAIGSPVAGLIAEARVNGVASLAQVPWTLVAAIFVAGIARLALGVVLAMLWLSPLLLGAMAASAWLKRWGVPALGAALAGGHVALSGFYGITVIGDTLRELWVNALYSIVHDGHPAEFKFRNSHELFSQWPVTPGQLLEGAQISLSNLAQPLFAFAVVMAVASFVLLVLRRSRA